MDDLERIFGELARSVPDGPPGEAEFVFRPEIVPPPPRRLVSERVFIKKTYHSYNSWYRADSLQVFVDSIAARQLGVFLLGCILHAPERAVLELPMRDHGVGKVIYRARHLNDVPLALTPSSFHYYPQATHKHPWSMESDFSSLPLLALSNESELVYTEEDWTLRDTVFIESSPVGTSRLAELLLNAGCTWNQVHEYVLEGEAGFRGVAPMSAELQILLPGSDGWNSHPSPEAARVSRV